MVLFFNDVSGSEVLVILAFILMFFGSKSIPGIAQTFGRTIRQIKDASNDLQEEIRKSGMDIKKDMNFKHLIEDSAREISQPLDQVVDELESSVKFEPIKNTAIPSSPSLISNEDVDQLPIDQQQATAQDAALTKDAINSTKLDS
ncbi:MAG: twin-arginine translocase TatA/TatE family subunit [Flavobacteriia bacterium]|jgi:Sec-independent protein translocase protein TatA